MLAAARKHVTDHVTRAANDDFINGGSCTRTKYRYEVYATDSTGNGPNSNIANASTFASSVAGSITYAYDALGRLVQANVAALGIVENYTYDASGNLLSMTSEPTATLAISDLSSPEGAPGSTLTIVGSGFSTNPSSDVVTINGVAATVVSATASELVVDVPAGATSGPVQVQTGTGTVTSSTNFTVTAAAGAPTITSFLPTDAATGATVTLTGTGFQSVLADNQVQVNQTAATVVAATPTSLTFVIPSFDGDTQNSSTFSAMSAPITVTTPAGSVTSATDLVISKLLISVPPIATVGGSPVTMATPSSGVSQLLGFSANEGQPVELVASSLSTPGGVLIGVIAPNGVSVAGGTLTTAGQSVLVPTPVTGRYSLYFYAEGNGGSVSWSVLGPVSGTLTLNGSPTTETVTVPGQSIDLTFTGTQGQNVTLSFTGVTLSSGSVTLQSPDGATVLSQPITTAGLTASPTLPLTGTYTVVITPGTNVTGALTAALTSGAATTLTPNQGTKSLPLSGTTPTTLTLAGSPGEILSLAVSETAGASSTLYVTVLQPDGSTLITRGVSLCLTCGTTVDLDLGPLTQAGTYSFVFQQTGTGSNTFAINLATPVTGSTTVGSTANVTVAQPGQGAEESFPGTAGQYVSASLFTTSASIVPAGTLSIIGPDGTTIASGILATCTTGCTAQGVASAGPLPSTGTYTVLYEQQAGQSASTGSLTITTLPLVTGTLTVGTSNAVVVAGGQGFAETFTASAGQSLSVGLQSNSTGPTNGTASILDPNGVLIASTAFNARTGYQTTPANAVLNVGPLAVGGTYTVLLQQATSAAGLGAGTITVTPYVSASGTLTLGSGSNVSLAPGQGFTETFTGTAGQYVSVALGSQGTTSPIAGAVTVFSAAGTQIATATYSGACSSNCSGAAIVDVGPLPASGQYTVVFTQTDVYDSFPGAGSLTVTAETAAQGTLTVGTPMNISLAAGQGAQETFTGSAGQYATVSVSETANLVQGAAVSVIGPSGTSVGTGTFTATCSTTCSGTSSFNIGPLPSAGTYTVLLQQSSQPYGFGSGTLTLSVTSTTANSGSSQNLSTTTAGASAQFTFNAAALQNFELAFSNMVLTPSTVTSYTVKVVDPTGATATTGSCTSGTTCLVALTYAKTGTYTVTLTPGGSATLSVTASVGPLVTGILSAGTPFTLNLPEPGENASLQFTATVGQELALQLSGMTETPNGTPYTVDVYDPTSTLVAASYPTSSTTLNIPTIALAGTYTVSVSTTVGSTASMQLTLLSGPVASVPATGTGVNISTSLASEIAYYTFSGTYGQRLTLALGNVVQTPSNASAASVSVSGPSPGYWGATCTSSCVAHSLPLPATGTYKATLTPGSGATISATAYLSPDVTGSITVGTPLNLTLSEPGQSASLTLNVTNEAPQTLALYVNNLTAAPAGTAYNVALSNFNAQGASVASTQITASTIFNLPNLAPGTYVLTITPAAPATATLQVTLEPQNGGNLATTSSGSGSTFTTPAPGQNSYFTFTGMAGQNLSLAFSNISLTPSSVTYFTAAVAGPGFSTSTTCSSASPSSCALALRNLPQNGIYTVTVSPSGAAAMTYTATLSADTTATLTTGTAQNVNLTATGQDSWLTFSATAGQTVALNVAGVATVPANTSYTITVYNSAETSVATASTTTGTTFNLTNLAAGNYNVLINSTSAATASMQVTVQPQTGGTLGLTSSGTGSAFTTPEPGQNAYFTFSGTAGQNLTLALTGISFVPNSVTYPTVLITGPSSYSVGGTCYATPGVCEIPLKTLPATGTYSVTVSPTGFATMSFGMTLSSVFSATLTPSTAQTVPLTAMGQTAQLNFTAAAGQTFALYASGITSTPANVSYTVNVYNSSGTSVASGSSSSTVTLNLPTLTAGTYSVVVTPATPATATLQLILEPQAGGALAFSGSSSAFSTVAPGQDAYFTFSGTAGQDLGLALTGLTLTPSSGQTYALVSVVQPNGTQFAYAYCYTSNPGAGCQLSLTNLPVTGTYSIKVAPGTQQTMSFTLTGSQDVSGTLALNTPQNVTLVPGQDTWLTFTATAGQTVAVSATSIVTNPAGQSVTLTIYNSSGTSVGTNAGTGSATVNLPNLATGTYSVLAVPAYGASATMQVTLAAGVSPALTFTGSTTSYSTTVPGQYAYYTFSGTAGQSLGLALTGLTLTPSSQQTYALVYVYEPNGTTMLTYAYCYTSSPGAGCQLSLTNLPVTGTYSIRVEPGSLQTMSFNLTSSQDVTGTLALNTPQNVTLVPGQNTWLSFTATAGQTVAVSASSVVTNPAGQAVTLTVYNSSGTSVGSASAAGSATVNLINLAAGTYSVLIVPAYGASATLQATLAAQTGAALTFNGSTTNYSTTVPGQYAYYTFSGTAGQDLAFALTGLTLTPSSQQTYALAYVYEPNGTTTLTYGYCYPSNPSAGCEFSLANLPVTGTYTIKIIPGTLQTMSFSLTASQDVTGTLVLNTPQAITLAAVGQNAWYTFTIASAQTVPVTTSGIAATPVSTSYTVTVYNSSGTSVGSTTTSSGNTLTLTSLPAGTYNVLISPQYPATAGLQLSY